MDIRIFYLVFMSAHIYTHIRSFTRVHLHANNPQYSSLVSILIFYLQNLDKQLITNNYWKVSRKVNCIYLKTFIE